MVGRTVVFYQAIKKGVLKNTPIPGISIILAGYFTTMIFFEIRFVPAVSTI
jgi:hypothetical protein